MSGSKIKVVVKLKKGDEFIDYKARIGYTMKMDGYTIGGKDQVKQVIRRALRTEKPLLRRIEEIATNIAKHVLLWVEVYKVERATASMMVDVGEYSDITIYTTLYYSGSFGWVAVLGAILDGSDGFTIMASHRVEKMVVLGKKLEDRADLLVRELIKVVRRVYNIYVEEEDNDEPTSLRTWTP